MINHLKQTLGIRDSLRLFAAADVVGTFSVLGEFSRTEVIRTFSEIYSTKCLDRALADLEAGNVLNLVQARKQDVSAGSSYRVAPFDSWGQRDSSRHEARKQRHGRGGCRQP